MDYFISDLHFGHKNIIEYEKRPFRSIEHMNDELVKRWNKVVTNEDTVFCLGDVSFCGAELTRNYVSALNGKKILIMGNHDRIRRPAWWIEKGFQEVYRFPIITMIGLFLGMSLLFICVIVHRIISCMDMFMEVKCTKPSLVEVLVYA